MYKITDVDVSKFKSMDDFEYLVRQLGVVEYNGIEVKIEHIKLMTELLDLDKKIRSNKIKNGINKNKKYKNIKKENIKKYNEVIELLQSGLSLNKSIQKVGWNKMSFSKVEKELKQYELIKSNPVTDNDTNSIQHISDELDLII